VDLILGMQSKGFSKSDAQLPRNSQERQHFFNEVGWAALGNGTKKPLAAAVVVPWQRVYSIGRYFTQV
jgi:hypothetical protein